MPDGYVNPDNIGSHARSQTRGARRRQRGEIGFVYVPLSDAIGVARALLDLGGIPCDRDQLSAKMGHSLSGAFVNKISAAKQFGLIDLSQGKIKLTQLGHAILDVNRSTAAKATAFLRVELFHRIYETFRNAQLPPRPVGLEQAIAEFGVPEKQKDKARRAFETSAKEAGYFAHGIDRLVAPVIPNAGDEPAKKDESKEGSQREDHTARKPDKENDQTEVILPAHHPFIKGLLLSLPTKLHENWTAADRVKWLRTAVDAFELMFCGGSPITVTFLTEKDKAPE
jgi:hypothetical protein